jgi:hypothetical protein
MTGCGARIKDLPSRSGHQLLLTAGSCPSAEPTDPVLRRSRAWACPLGLSAWLGFLIASAALADVLPSTTAAVSSAVHESPLCCLGRDARTFLSRRTLSSSATLDLWQMSSYGVLGGAMPPRSN